MLSSSLFHSRMKNPKSSSPRKDASANHLTPLSSIRDCLLSWILSRTRIMLQGCQLLRKGSKTKNQRALWSTLRSMSSSRWSLRRTTRSSRLTSTSKSPRTSLSPSPSHLRNPKPRSLTVQSLRRSESRSTLDLVRSNRLSPRQRATNHLSGLQSISPPKSHLTAHPSTTPPASSTPTMKKPGTSRSRKSSQLTFINKKFCTSSSSKINTRTRKTTSAFKICSRPTLRKPSRPMGLTPFQAQETKKRTKW